MSDQKNEEHFDQLNKEIEDELLKQAENNEPYEEERPINRKKITFDIIILCLLLIVIGTNIILIISRLMG